MRLIDSDHLAFRLNNALAGWYGPSGFVSIETDREVGRTGSSAQAQPGSLSRHPGAQCRISSFVHAKSFSVSERVLSVGVATVYRSRCRLDWAALLTAIFAVDVTLFRPRVAGLV